MQQFFRSRLWLFGSLFLFLLTLPVGMYLTFQNQDVRSRAAEGDTLPPNIPIEIDVADPNRWNIRFDGAYPEDQLGYYAVQTGDFDGDGLLDYIIGARQNNGTIQKGQAYLIYGSHLKTLAAKEKSNIIDLADSNNWNIRFDGAVKGDSGARLEAVGDFDGDGLLDFTFGSYRAAYNGYRTGSVYIITNPIFNNGQYNIDGKHTTGNVISLAATSNFNIRFDGVFPSDQFTVPTAAADIDGNGKLDLVIGNWEGERSVYLFYDTLISNYAGTTGTILSLKQNTNYNIKFTNVQSSNRMVITDVNGDGKQDLVFGDSVNTIDGVRFSGSVYIVYHDLFSGIANTGNIVDMTNPANWNIRFDATTNAQFGNASVAFGDINGNGKKDMIIGARTASNSGTDFSGSLYVLYDDLFSNISGIGNVVSLKDPTKWNIRYDGTDTFDYFSWGISRLADMDNDGKLDIVAGSSQGSVPNRYQAGTWFVIFNSLFSPITGTGNIRPIADNANYNIKYYGAAPGDNHGYGPLIIQDINGDGGNDVIAPSFLADPNGRRDAGSVYIIYYFPHTITIDPIFSNTSGKAFVMTGTVSAPNNTTKITRIQWGHDRSFGNLTATVTTDFRNAWIDCKPTDGTFDSNEEKFTCSHSPLDGRPNFGSPHTIFMRAMDEKGIWTPISKYVEKTFTNTSPISAIEDSYDPVKKEITLTWTTSEPSTSQVDYGDVGNTISSPLDTTMTTNHKVIINTTTSCPTLFRIRSKDIANNEAVIEKNATFSCIFPTLTPAPGVTLNMSSPETWDIRFDGALPNDNVGLFSVNAGDFDSDGLTDYIVGARQNSGTVQKGQAYLIYGSYLPTVLTKGKAIDLADPTNWNMRFDGAATGDSGARIEAVGDMDGDGKDDFTFGSYRTSYTGNRSGSVYIISNPIIRSYTGTGNIVSLSDTKNFFMRFDGGVGNAQTSVPVVTEDVDGNGKLDLLIGNNGNPTTYLIYDTIIRKYSGTGNILSLKDKNNYNLVFNNVKPLNRIVVADINNDGKQDLLFGDPDTRFAGAAYSGSLYIIYHDLFASFTSPGNAVNMSDSRNWTIRYDEGSGAQFANVSVDVGDLNNNGKNDLIVGARTSSNNSISNSGSLYIIYDNLISGITGSGNILSLKTNPNTWNIRYDGAAANDFLSYGASTIADINHDGKNDIIVGSPNGNNTGSLGTGVVYVLYNPLFSSVATTGNAKAISDPNNYSLKYVGAAPGDQLGYAPVMVKDLNQDGKNDLILPAWFADPNGRKDAGSVYIIFSQ